MSEKMKDDKKATAPEYGVDSRYSSKKAQQADGKALMEARLNRMKEVSPDEIIGAKLLQLRLRIEEFLKKPGYQKHNFFSIFLSDYIDIMYAKRGEFASDIGVTAVRLSQITNNHRDPHDDFLLRLMVHSEKTFQNVCDFPQTTWHQVYYQEKISETLSTQDEWRPEVEKNVKMNYTKKSKK